MVQTYGSAKNLKQVTSNTNAQYQNAMKQYETSKQVKNANNMMNATVDDIAKKYGFDYSRNYAKQQSESLAQAERNAYEHSQRLNQSQNQMNTQRINRDVKSSNQDIDNSFFQQYLQQQQSQVNSGINSGIASDQDFRLGMAQQQALSDVYRDANINRQEEAMRFGNESMRLSEALDLVEKQRIAKENELFQQMRQQGFENLIQERSQGMQMSQFEWSKAQDKIASMFNISKMEAERIIREAEFSGKYDGVKTAEQLAREFQQNMAKDEMAFKREQFAYQKQLDAQKLALQRAAASRSSRSYGGGSGGGSSSGSAAAPKKLDSSTSHYLSLAAKQLEQQDQYGGGRSTPIIGTNAYFNKMKKLMP
jgi:hypothetical protein